MPPTGCSQSLSNSDELALVKPATYVHIQSMRSAYLSKYPSKEFLFSRAYCAVRILPSTPR